MQLKQLNSMPNYAKTWGSVEEMNFSYDGLLAARAFTQLIVSCNPDV